MSNIYTPEELTIRFMIWRAKYLPEHENKTPVTHYKMIDYYANVDEDGFGLIQCHRGLGKTQITMEWSLFCICEGYEEYVLFVGATQDLTNEIVASASELALDIPNITVTRAVEGILEIINKNGEQAFLVAKSTGSKLRGVAKGKKRFRPSALVLDDLVSDDLVQNRMRMDRANRWLASALLPTLKPSGKVYGTGTPMHLSDPFMTLVKQFGSFKIPLSDKSFPDRFTPEFIARKYEQYKALGMLRSWKQEYELILTDAENRLFDMDKIRFVDDYPTGLNWVLVCDLAISEASSADYSALVAVGLDERTGKVYIYPTQGRWKPSEVSREIFRLVDKFGIIDVGIEQGATYLAVKEHIDKQMLDYQTYFNVVELKHQGKAKISRIKSLEPIVNSGRMVIIDNGEASEVLVEQMELTDLEACRACSSYDTIVETTRGSVKMGELLHDDKIFAYTGKKSVVLNMKDYTMTGVKRIFEVILVDGTSLKFTSTHPLLTQRGWVLLQDLLPSDSIIKDDTWKQLNIITELGDSIVKDTSMPLSKEKEYIFIDTFMNRKLEKYLRIMKYTILTLTRRITHYLILKLYQLKITEADIELKEKYQKAHKMQEITTNQEKKMKDTKCAKSVEQNLSWHGKLKMALNFAHRSVSKGLIAICTYLSLGALYAINNSSKMLLIRSAVQQSVAKNIIELAVELPAWNIRPLASGVEISLLQKELKVSTAQKTARLNSETGVDMQNQIKGVAVRIRKITEVGIEPVYNFEVDTYKNYLVEGGFVSHNSHDDIIDAVAYLTSMNILSGDIELNNHLQSEYEEIESRYDKDYGFALSD